MRAFADIVRTRFPVPRRTLRWISSLTGGPITDAEATDPAYWARQTARAGALHATGVGKLIDPNSPSSRSVPARRSPAWRASTTGPQAAQLIVTSLHPGQEFERRSRLPARGRRPALDARRRHRLVARSRLRSKRRRYRCRRIRSERQRHWVDSDCRSGAISNAVHTPTPYRTESASARRIPLARVQRCRNHPPIGSAQMLQRLQTLFADLSGIDAGDARRRRRHFLELGLDSLFLTQASNAMQKQFGAKISIRDAARGLLRRFEALAARLVSTMPADPLPERPALAPTTPPAVAPHARQLRPRRLALRQ